jgi:uncharacterized membrane protein
MDPNPTEGVPSANDGIRTRWLSALGYIGPLCLLPMLASPKNDFLRAHARRGFLLFLMEVVVLVFLLIVDNTLGRIPLLGFLLVILLQFASFVVFLVLSLLGFVKALAGEDFRLPVLDEYAERVPVAD